MIIDNDVGFMVPLDEDPGKKNNNTMCLWNGLLAAAPGHPFLAAVIETVVNNVRNKFTAVDVMQSLCPDVDLYVTHSWDLLHTSEFIVEIICSQGSLIVNPYDTHNYILYDSRSLHTGGDCK